jgi:hypothetical protein
MSHPCYCTTFAVIQYPPMLMGGWLYTWGSGYHGQLAQVGAFTFF